jgi:hypothetical protein
MRGIKIDDLPALDAAGVDHAALRALVKATTVLTDQLQPV